jgi:hypothetical protein
LIDAPGVSSSFKTPCYATPAQAAESQAEKKLTDREEEERRTPEAAIHGEPERASGAHIPA